MELLGSEHRVRSIATHLTRTGIARDMGHSMRAAPLAQRQCGYLRGRLAACVLALLFSGLSVIVFQLAALPSTARQASTQHVPAAVRLPSPLQAESSDLIVLPARADSHTEQHVRAVALPTPLAPTPQAVSAATRMGPSSVDGLGFSAIVVAIVLLFAAFAVSALLKRARRVHPSRS